MSKNIKRLLSILTIGLLSVGMVSCIKYGPSTPSDDDKPPVVEPETYTIQYMDDNGTHTIEVASGSPYSLDIIPERKGYEFIGLFDAEEGGTQYVNASGSALSVFTDNKNLILFPQFRAKEYNLILDYQDAPVTGTRQLKVAYDSYIEELPTNLKIDNQEFVGWFTEPNGEGKQIADRYGIIPGVNKIIDTNFDLTDENNNIYLYADFKGVEYTVTFYVGNSYIPEEVKVEHGTLISDVIVESRFEEKAVLTWSKIQNDINKTQVFNGRVTSDLVLYACEYAPVLELNSNGGEKIKSVIARAGDSISLPIPIRENYKFMGWIDSTGSIYNPKIMPNESKKLTAKWQAMLIFDTNGGTEVENISLPKGNKVELPETSKDGYIFAGWYQNNTKYENTSMPEYSIILEARYYKVNKEKIVLIGANKKCALTRDDSYPSLSSDIYEIDLSDVYAKGVREVKIKANYYAYRGCLSFGKDGYVYMNWYSEKSVSEAYMVWNYSDKFVYGDDDYKSFVKVSNTIKLTSEKLYVCIYQSGEIFGVTGTTVGAVKDFWIEVEYPDMSNLY